jgi:predicted RNase H-like nuclease
MRFLGVDLAWGERAATGLASVEADGKVTASATRVDLDSIVAWCKAQTKGDVLVAVDAPIIVPNSAGRRVCEQIVSLCYGGRNASAHSSNTSMKPFALQPRGAQLAAGLGLEMDPLLTPNEPVSRLIEVYPHPAIVTLFGLDTILPYKAKRRRSAAVRCVALNALMTYIERLANADPPMHVAAHPRWAEMREAIAGSPSNGRLNRIEDEIDAYVCAYIGLFYWHNGLARSRVVGNLELGYIVTPVTGLDGSRIDKWQSALVL